MQRNQTNHSPELISQLSYPSLRTRLGSIGCRPLQYSCKDLNYSTDRHIVPITTMHQ